MLLIVTFCIRHALSGVALSDLLTLVELHCLLPNHCAKTTKLLREVFGKLKSPIELHYYCSFCQEYFGTKKPSCCSNTACLLDSEKKRSELQYFIIIPFITQREICRSHVFPGVCNFFCVSLSTKFWILCSKFCASKEKRVCSRTQWRYFKP